MCYKVPKAPDGNTFMRWCQLRFERISLGFWADCHRFPNVVPTEYNAVDRLENKYMAIRKSVDVHRGIRPLNV